MENSLTNQLIDNYYEELSKVRTELTNRIKDIVKENIVIYDTSEGTDDTYYELPTFYIVNKYSQYDTYSIVKITKDLEIVGDSWEEGDTYTMILQNLVQIVYTIYTFN